MEPVDTLVCARWVLPVEPDGSVLADHSVAMRAGRIVAVLPTAAALAAYAPAELVERPQHAILPGLVNAHTHAAMTLLRGRAENLPLAPWLQDAIAPVERRWVDPEYVRDGTELAIAEMLRGGITCFADMQLWPEVVARTAADAHMRVSVGLVVEQGASRWAADPNEYIEKGMALRDDYRGDALVATHFALEPAHALDDPTLARVRRLADELEIPVTLPVHESAWEVTESLARHGARPLDRLVRLGFASPLLVAVHGTQLSPADIDALAACGAAVVHCPESNLKLGSGVCPTAALLGCGVRVALGTDGAASNNDLDMLSEMRTAGLLAAGVSARPGTVVARDLLRMATLEGARALGLGDSTGSLVPGKWADLCCVNLRTAGSWPVHDVEAALVYACSSRQVTDTWVAGRHVFAEGSLRYIDEESALERAEAWRARIDAADDRSRD
ncbi:MAG: TRZ/ATZ family hydrolase [Gammaproteobacteria bacterium]|nr:TRZ/ATZ family hydrolase [Gammaproteobacteria bacterium]MDH4311808.1 TRZ/ATZ family hydrolase [Gammaproteobacteria bacterium]